jgi:hypothetical protein
VRRSQLAAAGAAEVAHRAGSERVCGPAHDSAEAASDVNARNLLERPLKLGVVPVADGDAVGAAVLGRRARSGAVGWRAGSQRHGSPLPDRLVLYAAGTGSGIGARVTAPSEAEETSAAYFASTPEA